MSFEKELSNLERKFNSGILEISLSNLGNDNPTHIVGIDVTKFNDEQKKELVKLFNSTEFEKMLCQTCHNCQ